jgi:cyclin T
MLLRESTRMYVEVSSSIRYGIIVVALVCFTHILRIIHQQEVLEKQKALILVGETLLLSTIQFDFDIQHPYEPLKLALKNLGITQKEVKQASISLINDT